MSLFPSAKATPQTVETNSDSSLQWLHNSSYKGQQGYKSEGSSIGNVLLKTEKCQSGNTEGSTAKKETLETKFDCTHSHRSRHRKRAHSPNDSSSKSEVKREVGRNNKKHKKHHRKDEDEKSSREKHVKKKHRSRSRSPKDRTHSRRRPSSIWLDDQKNTSDSLFFIDEKPDRDNLSLESLHFKDAAFYKRLGKTCLGGSGIYWTDKQKMKGQIKQWKKDRYFSPSSSANLNDETVDMSKVENDLAGEPEKVSGFTNRVEPKETKAAVFIPVETMSTKIPSKSSEVDPLGLYDDATKQYLGLGVGGQKLDKANDSRSDSQNTLRNPLTERVASYNRHLSENPSDTAKWVEFIHFQGELLSHFTSSASNQESYKSEEKLLTERKLTILTSALEKNPGSLELRLEQVELCKNLWEHGKVDELWQKMLKDHSKSVDLWKHYLLYSQSAYSTFSVSKIASLYGECIQSLQEDLCKDDGNSNIIEELLEIFVQLCHFWHQAGHTEKAVAAFQAMIELNLFCPPNLEDSTSLSAQIAFLETLWDADVPKFGETGAQGWNKWMLFKEKGGWQQTNPRENDDNEDDEHSIDSTYRGHSWLMEETWRARSHFLPWHPDMSKGQTTDYCEDPDRLVLFDDISKVLFKLNTPGLKFQLILRFLELLGVSIEASSTTNSSHSHHFCHTVLQCTRQLSCIKFAVSVGDSSQSHDESSLPSSWHSLWQRFCPGVYQSFDTVSDAACSEHEDATLDLPEEEESDFQAISKFIDSSVEQLLSKFSEEEQSYLRMLNLRFHLTKMKFSKDTKIRKGQIKHVQKIAKKVLSMESNRNNLTLWETYALWEWGMGNHKEAQRILETALSFAGVPKREVEIQKYTRVIHTYATLKLQLVYSTKGRSQTQIEQSEEARCQLFTKEVVNALTTLGEGVKFIPLSQYHESSVSSGRILKARKRFVELLDECKMEYSPIVGPSPAPGTEDAVSPSGSYLFHLSCCYALFQYLTVSLQGANIAFQDAISFIEKVPSNSVMMSSLTSSQKDLDHELLTVSHIQILSYHTAVNPVSIVSLRSMLQRALLKYPSNSTLLEVLIQTESKAYVMGRLRRHFDHVTETCTSPLPMFFAILCELRRQDTIKEATKERSLTFDIKDTVISETGVSHRIRSLFEKAVSSRHTRHCILFWRMFLEFEVTQRNMKRAKSVFYRSLQNCPWAKVIYMDMIRYFPAEEDLLEEMVDLMTEKEIRIRCPLEELDMIIMNVIKDV
ncbi:Protein NRDE2-like [Holothuria leucospilota]|uniref:Protein NRDE2-like n=1 Tax=Holothuria leucospilota TaxID=206669 RepID=A0A9Q1CG30_HOLLE|nr:Protein NRDE2-like [Holothuria leucospilota]